MTDDEIDYRLPLRECWLLPRHHAELTADFRQVVPYVIFYADGKVAVYKRSTTSNEHGLWNLESIGFGGHIELSDFVHVKIPETLTQVTNYAAHREITEEVCLPEVIHRQTIGVLIDNDNEVGKRHIGIVQIWCLLAAQICSLEDRVENCRFLNYEEVLCASLVLENWSRLIWDYEKKEALIRRLVSMALR